MFFTLSTVVLNVQPSTAILHKTYCFLYYFCDFCKNLLRGTFGEIFTFWADNCNAQSKNWWLFSALVNYVNSKKAKNPVKMITVNFFVPGHGFMSADSFHHQVDPEEESQE